jgi:DNA-binding IscR family transcriptional regulator
MGEIVRVLEGPIAPMICATEGEMTQICGFLDSCRTKYLWAKLRDVVAQTLDNMSLADLARAEAAQEHNASSRFIALSDIQVVSDMRFALPAKESEPQVRPLS